MKRPKKPWKTVKPIIVPPVGISKNGKLICVLCHLHGVLEENIKIDLDRTRLVISASKEEGDIKKKNHCPCRIVDQ
jgi:HSP20 family molecular chaperone IbpA